MKNIIDLESTNGSCSKCQWMICLLLDEFQGIFQCFCIQYWNATNIYVHMRFQWLFLECSSKIGRSDANDAGICRLALAHCLFKGVLVPQPTKTNTGSVKFAENRVNAPPPKRTKKKRPTSNVLRATFSSTWFTWEGHRHRQQPALSSRALPFQLYRNSMRMELIGCGNKMVRGQLVQWVRGGSGKSTRKTLGQNFVKRISKKTISYFDGVGFFTPGNQPSIEGIWHSTQLYGDYDYNKFS